MFSSTILEVGIGLALVYVLLSTLCTVLTEAWARVFGVRSNTLESGVRNLLNDPSGSGLAKDFYDHPLIVTLALKDRGLTLLGPRGKPSYIPSRNFALALLDLVAPAGVNPPETTGELKDKLTLMPNGPVKRSLLSLVDAAGDDLNAARKSIETWFDDAMDRVNGWYKRKAQVCILVTAAAMSIGLNADSIMLANRLWLDPAVREAAVTAAKETLKQPDDAPDKQTAIARAKEVENQLQQLQLPIGWSSDTKDPRHLPTNIWGWLSKIAGLAGTVTALSLGAPFWFDALKKLVNMRAAGNPPAKTSQTEQA